MNDTQIKTSEAEDERKSVRYPKNDGRVLLPRAKGIAVFYDFELHESPFYSRVLMTNG
uniref:Uncharacterized protein n=1 Tax=Candidatus Kentrum sp. UNK TaxID=2126344 RepID=A0A451AIZ9_9GAMM|nr:MAG: hypothetical protein BECKUNK1418G_GA0071005_107610 [Candidatus Kentron sp. UNK]VFK69086.1 MAG: hypothetical protein BECKUNK1418H_GA0071006_101010 [Candidatus Kentron sp. UNK]